MAEDKRNEEAKKKAADEKAALAKVQTTQRASATGKPTPTQEELDAANLGVPLPEHEPDGSAVEGDPAAKQKELEAHKPSGGYDTRAMAPSAARRAPASE